MKTPLNLIIALVFLSLMCCAQRLEAQAQWTKLLDTPCYGFSANPLNPRTLYVGGGARAFYRSYDAGMTWDTIYVEFQGSGEEFLNVVVHPIDTNIIIIGGSRFGTIRRSIDRGSNWDIVLPPTTSHTFNGESIIVDRSNQERVYAADFNSGVIYRSSNRGADWDSLSALPIDSSTARHFQNQPCSLTQRADSTNIFFAGCIRSHIFRSDDYGKTWRFIAKLRSSPLDEPELPQLHFSPTNPMIGYAISSYFFYQARPNGGFYKTIDGGEHWNLTAFTDTAFWCMTTRPLPGGAGDEIVLGGFTEYFSGDSIVPGSKIILRSIDNGKSWWNYQTRVPWGESIDNSVLTMRYVGSSYETQKLYASTVSGIYVLGPEGLADVHECSSGSVSESPLHISANEFLSVRLDNSTSIASGGEMSLQIFDALGRSVYNSTMTMNSSDYASRIDHSSWNSGVYLVCARNNAVNVTRAFVIDR